MADCVERFITKRKLGGICHIRPNRNGRPLHVPRHVFSQDLRIHVYYSDLTGRADNLCEAAGKEPIAAGHVEHTATGPDR